MCVMPYPQRIFLSTLLMSACSDYDIKDITSPESLNTDSASPETDENAQVEDSGQETTDTSSPPVNEDDCGEDFVAFDIEDVSTLQDAVNYPMGSWSHDAVILNWDDSQLSPDQTWRISAVEALVMIPTALFNSFPDDQVLNIEVFDGNNPTTATRWSASRPLIKSELSWSDYTLPFDAYHASIYNEFQQKGAWLRFDMTDQIPESGMSSSTFVTGIWWTDPGLVRVGYSNFNRDCSKNWTDYGSGWILNTELSGQYTCSWPMLKVEIEIITPGDCEDE